MSDARDRYREFGRGLCCGGVGAGIGLVFFWTAYLVVFARCGPLTALNWFSPGFSMTAVLQSFVFVTTAGILGRRTVAVSRVMTYSCLALLITPILNSSTSIGWHTRKAMLLDDPLAGMQEVWWIFGFNVAVLAASFAAAPRGLECSRSIGKVEKTFP